MHNKAGGQHRSWHFALIMHYTYHGFFYIFATFTINFQCSSMTITCCTPAHLHQLPSLARTSNQH